MIHRRKNGLFRKVLQRDLRTYLCSRSVFFLCSMKNKDFGIMPFLR